MGSDRTSGVMSVGRSGSSFTVMPEITSACGAVGVETVPLTYYKEHSEVREGHRDSERCCIAKREAGWLLEVWSAPKALL